MRMTLVLALWTTITCFSASVSCFAQHVNIGIPPVRNFSNKLYDAGTQNWQITQDQRGVIYVANNEGLLEFDGNHWRTFPITHGSSLRSVEIAKDGKIYVGGQGEIGYFEANEMGVLSYHTLSTYFPDGDFKFEDVWEIIENANDIYFMSQKMVMKWDGQQITVPVSGDGYLFFDKIGDRFYIQKANFEFGYYQNNLESAYTKIADLPTEVTSMLPMENDTVLVATDKQAIFQLTGNLIAPWTTSADRFLKENRIFCTSKLPNGNLAIGTTSSGVLVMDGYRRIIQHISKEDNLQNNTVLSIFSDKSGNLWTGLDNGVSYIQANSALTEFFPDGNLEGTCYSAEIYENQLYTGTNTGVYQIAWQPYYLPAEKKNFNLTPNTEGQVWSIANHNGTLLAGHQNGPYLIKDQRAALFQNLLGVWRFQPINEGYLVAGHYSGLDLFKQNDSGIEHLGKVDGLDESSRLLAFDGSSVWMAHPYRGIFRVDVSVEEISASHKFYGAEDGLPSNFNNHLFQLNDRIVFAGEKGVFRFDEDSDRFLPDEGFNEIFGSENRVKYLRQDVQGNIWYVVENEVGVLKIQDDALDKHIERMEIPELSGKLVGGFEFILPIDEQNVLFATEKGFIHLDPTQYNIDPSPIKIILSEVWLKSKQDSLIFGGYLQNEEQENVPILSHRQNALEFIYSSTDHEDHEFVTYSHILEGSGSGWSAWNENTSLDINNLSPGDYVFKIKARDKTGQESAPATYRFIIDPPWYASPLAFAFYGFLLVGAFIGLAFFQNKKHKKEKAFLESTHLQEQEKKEELVRQSKEKISQLERQKLEAEVKFKNQELAAATMNLVQKSEMLTAIQASLEKMKKPGGKRDDLFGEINRLLKLVKLENNIDEDWDRFSMHFDQVHSDFLKRLGEKHPNLSPNDFKLSAYLRMNLSSKEIASLMNISIRGVEAGRYRLRKRLELDPGENLAEYILRL